MKKLLILVLTLFSLEGFSANYEIVKDPAIKISKQDIQKNNKSIEEAIKVEYAWNSEADWLVSSRNEAIDEYENLEKASYFLEKPYFEAINEVGTMFEKYTITEIKYYSPTKVEVYITEYGKFLEDIAKSCKVEVNKKFKAKMGYLPEDFRENVKNKTEVRKVYEEYRNLMKKELLSKRKEIENTEEGSLEVSYTVEKKNNKWLVIERHARVN